jgi:hypothetical protein
MQLVSDTYLALLKREHTETQWGGADTKFRHMEELVKAKTILDYGSGRESLRNHLASEKLDYKVHCFDPGTGKTGLPLEVDVVVAKDVLEHVEPNLLSNVLYTIFTTATKGVYLVIALRQAGRKLVDGSPAHLIVQPARFWLERLAHYKHWRVVWCEFYEGYELRCWMVKA